MNLKRFFKRTSEEIGATVRIAKVTSWGEAINTLRAKADIQRMVRNGYRESPAAKKRLLKKHATMLKYFESTFGDYIASYPFDKPEDKSAQTESDQTIWICWWQGIDNAPPIVKACVDSVKEHAGTHPVVIITEENYRDYVSIPDWVEEKRKKGILSRTHFSDLLRLSLLAEHGGLWLDATFFCCGSLEPCFKESLWSIKRPDYLHCSVAGGMFADYSLQCRYETRWVFTPIRDFWLHYWKNNDKLIDYLVLDYMFVLVQKHNREIAELFDRIPPNNPKCDELCNILNDAYDAEKWTELTRETYLFKLTWKQTFSEKDTFYGKLIHGELPKN